MCRTLVRNKRVSLKLFPASELPLDLQLTILRALKLLYVLLYDDLI